MSQLLAAKHRGWAVSGTGTCSTGSGLTVLHSGKAEAETKTLVSAPSPFVQHQCLVRPAPLQQRRELSRSWTGRSDPGYCWPAGNPVKPTSTYSGVELNGCLVNGAGAGLSLNHVLSLSSTNLRRVQNTACTRPGEVSAARGTLAEGGQR